LIWYIKLIPVVLYPGDKQQAYGEESKAIPLHAWTGPDGFRRLRLPDFMTIDT
jgi:hypothetical protein